MYEIKFIDVEIVVFYILKITASVVCNFLGPYPCTGSTTHIETM